MGHDPGLVVGGAAAVEAAVALGRLERRAVPVGVVAGRLHVVVGVEHDGRRALGPGDVPDDGRGAALADDLDLEALGAQQLGGRLGRRLDVGLVEGGQRDARDPGQGLEVGAQLGHEAADGLAERESSARAVGVLGSVTSRPYSARAARGTQPGGIHSGGVRTQQDHQRRARGAGRHAARDGAKNRPTPKRRDQEAARKQPLVVTDRKAARSADRAKRREAMAKQRQAMLTGDETHLPPRDKGPVKRYIRDYVDARWGVAEFMLPVMLIVLALSFVRQPWAMLIVFALVYGLITAAAIDTFLMWRRSRRSSRPSTARRP